MVRLFPVGEWTAPYKVGRGPSFVEYTNSLLFELPPRVATVSVALSGATVSAAGQLEIRGSHTATLDDASLSSTATLTAPPTFGTLVITLGNVVSASFGSLTGWGYPEITQVTWTGSTALGAVWANDNALAGDWAAVSNGAGVWS